MRTKCKQQSSHGIPKPTGWPTWLPYNCSIRGRAVSQSQCLSQVPSVLAGSERNIGSATATLSKRNTSGKLCDFLRWFWPCVSLLFSSLNMADGKRQHFWILTEGNCRRKVLFRQKKVSKPVSFWICFLNFRLQRSNWCYYFNAELFTPLRSNGLAVGPWLILVEKAVRSAEHLSPFLRSLSQLRPGGTW